MGYLLVFSFFNENGLLIIYVFMKFVFVVCSWRSFIDFYIVEWLIDWIGCLDLDFVQVF